MIGLAETGSMAGGSNSPLQLATRRVRPSTSAPPTSTSGALVQPQKRSFTVRVPIELYLHLGQIPQDEGTDVNAVVKRLLKLGLGQCESLLPHLPRL